MFQFEVYPDWRQVVSSTSAGKITRNILRQSRHIESIAFMMPSISELSINNTWPVILPIRREILRERFCCRRFSTTLKNHF
jgi:hypothetical protein